VTKSRVGNLDKLERKLMQLKAVASADVLERALLAAAQPIRNDAQVRAPVRTSTLRRSIHVETFEKSEQRVSVLIGTDLEYAAIHEYGGDIVPRNARALVFEIDGEVIVTQRVTIPARPYLRPAYDAQRDEAVRIFRLAVADQVREAAK
jgi:HK97 gp10 family phage protein